MVTRPPFSNPEPAAVPVKATPAKRKAMPVKTPPVKTKPRASVKKKAVAKKAGWPQPKTGPVESAVRTELELAGVSHSALAASAIAMAQNVDRAESPAGASAAARELRIVLPLARTTVNPLSPPAGRKGSREEVEEDGSEPGPTRLSLVRDRAAKRAARVSS